MTVRRTASDLIDLAERLVATLAQARRDGQPPAVTAEQLTALQHPITVDELLRLNAYLLMAIGVIENTEAHAAIFGALRRHCENRVLAGLDDT